jgi:acetyltransferase AlgX (SGNH hydrolase-like protein)
MMLAGLAVGLVIMEFTFRHRDGGAFPHLNFYRPDPALGVRLEPGATEQIAFGGNPITSVRINAAGYRGADWPAPGKDEVLVVGDSQVFGLGVEEAQTFSTGLAALLHRPVINAGVPTYGPDEYRAVIAELVDQRHPTTVVLGLNMVNDLFEASHPNRTRHAVWDGWAVRRESAPVDVTDFPGRDFLYRRSHLFFALRKWAHAGDPVEERGFASEGTWQDLIATGQSLATERKALGDQARQTQAERRELQQSIVGADSRIEQALFDVLGQEVYPQYQLVNAGKANPGDIVDDNAGEEARAIVVTTDMIRDGAAVRAKLRSDLADWARRHRGKDAKEVGAALDKRSQALARLAALDAATLKAVLEPPLAAYIRDVAKLCAQHGARLVVVILPIDVQVSADEWKKYGKPAVDMAPSRVLIDELVAAATAAGVSALDASPALAAAEPGAFLDKDIHMTPKGHAAVAAALAKAIAAPPPALAAERTVVPVPVAWREAPEIVVTGSTSAGCETKMVHEWLRVMCGRVAKDTAPPSDQFADEQIVVDDPIKVAVESDDTGEAMVLAMPHQTSLVAPVLRGHDLTVLFTWSDHTRRLHVSWPSGQPAATFAFEAPVKIAGKKGAVDHFVRLEHVQTFASPVERAICQCWNTTFKLEHYKPYDAKDEVFVCSGAYGSADAACTTTYANDCPRMLECIRHDPASPPP